MWINLIEVSNERKPEYTDKERCLPQETQIDQQEIEQKRKCDKISPIRLIGKREQRKKREDLK